MTLKGSVVSMLQEAGMLQLAMDLYQTTRGAQISDVVTRLRYPLNRDPGRIPLPGLVRRVSVAGTADLDWFLKSGRLAAENITACLQDQGTDNTHFLISVAAAEGLPDIGASCLRLASVAPIPTAGPFSGVKNTFRSLTFRETAWHHLLLMKKARSILCTQFPYSHTCPRPYSGRSRKKGMPENRKPAI